MRATRAAARYGEALLQVASQREAVQDIRRELEALVELVAATPELEMLLARPDVAADQKLGILRSALGDGATETIMALLDTLVRHGRGDEVAGVSEVYGDLADEAAGLVKAEVATVVPLTTEQRARLVSALRRMTGRQVELDEHLDPDILAGVRVRLGDRMIDGSAAGRLERMRAHLVRARG